MTDEAMNCRWDAPRAFSASELPVYQGKEQVSSGWLNKYMLDYTLPDGTPKRYEAVSRKKADAYGAVLESRAAEVRPDAVCVVGHTAQDEFLLIREFRFPLNAMCVAFPAGLIDPGEDVLECADRELREETGFGLVRAEDGRPAQARVCVQPGFSSLGMSDECIAMVFAEVERVGQPQTEAMEFIQTILLPRADIQRFLCENRDPLSIRAQLVLEMMAYRPFE